MSPKFEAPGLMTAPPKIYPRQLRPDFNRHVASPFTHYAIACRVDEVRAFLSIMPDEAAEQWATPLPDNEEGPALRDVDQLLLNRQQYPDDALSSAAIVLQTIASRMVWIVLIRISRHSSGEKMAKNRS